MRDTVLGAARTGRRSFRIGLAAVLFLSTATTSASFFTPALAQEFSFSQVVVEGNRQVDASTIVGLAGIKRGQAVSMAGLNDAYQGLQRSGLFETVEIDRRVTVW
jgi:outer membrane protein insertion porin family